jgi:cation transport regulator ChaC
MSELWVFGYGSLMWNPGFEFAEQAAAALAGARRSRMSLPQRMPNNSLTPPEVHL